MAEELVCILFLVDVQLIMLCVNQDPCSDCLGVNYHANIKNLDISYNKIGVIHKQYFRPVEISLTHLHLSHNTIMNATRDAFGNMPHLNWIDLSHNRIYDFEYDTFRNTKNLQVIRKLIFLKFF